MHWYDDNNLTLIGSLKAALTLATTKNFPGELTCPLHLWIEAAERS